MRKLFITLAAIAAFAACTKTYEPALKEETKTVNFLAQSIETKTAFGTPDGTTYPTLWTSNDERVKINVNGASSSVDGFITPSSDFTTATFSGNVIDPSASSYIFRVLSPSTAHVGYAQKGWSIEIPATQTPSATSVDEAAMVLAAKSAEMSSFPTETVVMDFKHVTAYGKLTISNLPSTAGAVSKVTLTSDVNIVGRFYYNDETVSENTASNVLTINTTSLGNIWFACAPATVAGTNIKITVTTANGDYTKTVKIPTGKNFVAGKIAKMNVDFTGVTASDDVVYTLVKSTGELTVGSQVIIATDEKAISTTQNGNNRAAAAITVDGETIKNPSESVQILEVDYGFENMTIALFTGEQYLRVVSGSNYLRQQAENDSNSSFAVEIDSETGVALLSSNDRTIKYNSSSSVFASYASGQTDVKMYKKVGSGSNDPALISLPVLSAPVIATQGDASQLKVTVTWTDVENATSYLVQCGTASVTVNPGVQTHTFTVDKYDSYAVYVTAKAEGYRSAKSAKSTVTLIDPSLVTYTLTITSADIAAVGSSTSGYAAYNGTQTWTATGSNGSTLTVNAVTYQVMPQSTKIQGQKSAGYIYNTTDLGSIQSIKIDGSNFNYVVGNKEHPTSSVSKAGYFTIKAGSNTASATSITITFVK